MFDISYGTEILNVNNEELIIAGNKYLNDTASNIVIQSVDTEIKQNWSAQFGLPNSLNKTSSICKTPDAYYIFGQSDAFGVFGVESYLVQTTAKGDTEKTSFYNNINDGVNDYGLDIIETSDNNLLQLILVEENSTYNLMLVKLNGSTKSIMWQYKVLDDCLPVQCEVIESSDNNYVVAAATDQIDGQLQLIKVNNQGDKVLFKKALVSLTAEQHINLIENNKQQLVLLTDGMELIIADKQGDEIRRKSFGGRCDGTDCLKLAADGGYIIAGSTNSDKTGTSDIVLYKTDPEGKIKFDENRE